MTTLPQTSNIRLPRQMSTGPLAVQGPSAQQSAATSSMSAGDVWRVIRANAWIVSGSVLICAVIGFGVNWYLARNFARYTATGWVQITPTKRPNIFDTTRVEYELDPSILQIEQRTQSQLLRTDALLNTVLNRPAVRETGWFKQFLHTGPTGAAVPDLAAAKDDLDDRLFVSPTPESKLIQVQFVYSDANDCRTMINEIVDEHLNNQNTLRRQSTQDRTQDLNTTMQALTLKDNDLKNRINQTQHDLARDGITVTPGRFSPREQELIGLTQQQAKLQMDFNDANSELGAVNAKIANGEDPDGVEVYVLADNQLAILRSQIGSLQTEAIFAQSTGQNNPQYRAKQQALNNLQQQLDDREAELRGRLRIQVVGKLQTKVDATKASLQQVVQSIAEQKAALGDLDYKIFSLMQDKEEQHVVEEKLNIIEKQIQDADNQLHSRDLAGIEWAQHPEKPEIPSFPKLWMTLTASVMIGLMLSLGTAFARELLDTSVRSPRDIQRVGQMTLLGMIPHEDDDPQVTGVPLPLVIFQTPTSMIAEQFRQVRTRLQHATSLDTTRSILVTSPGPGDGKSVVAVNLAAGLALNGRRILLVDANFRRATLHKIFNISADFGFSSVLASPESFETAVKQTMVPNLDVLPTGPKPANPTELMESQLLVDFIEHALEEYDHVIFDSGPLLFVSETVALAPRVDGVVTVVRARSNSRGLLQRMRDGLRQLKAEHLGVVLNAVRSQGGGYYGRNIKTYYEYQNGHAA